MQSTDAEQKVRQNVAVHNRIARKYEKLHGEIFNDIEQARLRSIVRRALEEVRTGINPPTALDFGCGSGNLTSHLLACGASVTAADVAQGFLDLVRSRYPSNRLQTFLLNGTDLAELPDSSFDVVAAYSVLHHIPDYLGACREMARVCRKGGVILFDHEVPDEYWKPSPLYAEFLQSALRLDWRKYMKPANYLHRLRRVFDPRYSNEGDIHVWPDDHIEWGKITDQLKSQGFEIVLEKKYLLYRELYRREVYDLFKDHCADAQLMIFRKVTA